MVSIPGRSLTQIVPAQMPYGRLRDVRDSEQQQVDTPELTPPGPERLFRRESEQSWQARVQQKRRRTGIMERLVFPTEPNLSKEVYAGRAWPKALQHAEPNYVCYQRTLFEQHNFDRYGFDLGFITPIVSASKFYYDVFWLPHNAAREPWRCCECNRGYCLPGDPVPLYLYPPNISVTGLAAQGLAVTGVLALFP